MDASSSSSSPPFPSPDKTRTGFLSPDRLEAVSGWAGNARVLSYVYRPSTVAGIREVFATARAAGLPIGLRGSGLSYGDASLAGESISLDLRRMNRILDWNPETGMVRAEPGVTLRQLWEHVIPDGWFPPVVSGTMYPTLGGAAAMNIHGKNHYHAGTFGENLQEFDFLFPNGELRTFRPGKSPSDDNLFYWIIGSFGMLGVFTSLTLPMKRIHSGLLRTTRWAARDLSEMFAVFEDRLPHADNLVGWIDGFATGEHLGRGLVEEANELPPGEDPYPNRTMQVAYQSLPDTLFGWLPKSLLWRLARPWVNPAGVRMANQLQYVLGARGAGKQVYQTYAAVNFKLDYVPDWKKAYGPYGLMQYQVFVPRDEAQRVFRRLLALCQERDLPPYLIVFKRHRSDPFPMSYGGDGWSLAMDFPLTPKNRPQVWDLAAAMDLLVLDAGGRFYFAKDSTLHRSRLGSFLNEDRVQRFLALKREFDPEGLLQTELFRRVFGER
ncbi:MAG: FAD-binding oxidoreductase [Armatimonadaceae bacterium]